MKTICITALLGASQGALRCVDERVKAADAAKLIIDQEIKDAAVQQVKAMTDAKETNAQDLLSYESVMNTLSVAVVSARSYQLATEGSGDLTAKSNALGSVEASMKAMAYEQGKTGSEQIKKVLDEIRGATTAVRVAEQRRAKNEFEVTVAENACVPGQPGTPPPKSAKDEDAFQAELASIPAQINLKQIIKSDVCPNTCKTNYEAFEFENEGQRDQWLKDCLDQCDLETNIIDLDYASWQKEQENAAIVTAQIDENKRIIELGLGLETKLPSKLSKTDILTQYQKDPNTVKLSFACRTNDQGKVACFDQNGQQVNIGLTKDGVTAEDYLKSSKTTVNSIECNLYDKMFGMCQGALRSVGSYTATMVTLAASIVYISSDQSL